MRPSARVAIDMSWPRIEQAIRRNAVVSADEEAAASEAHQAVD